MKNIPLKDIMISKVITVNVNDSLTVVEEKFRKNKIRHIPVVDKGQVEGIISERDLLRCDATRKTEEGFLFDKEKLEQLILKYIMIHDPVTLGPEDSVMKAVDIMAVEKFGCIPIVDAEKKLVGIVSQIDILKLLSKWLHESA